MKKIFIVALLVIVGYFLFIQDSLKGDLNFDQATYVHVKKMRGGEVTNHFYTPSGEGFETAKSFIQIIKFSDKIQKSDWISHLNPLLNRYHLKPIDNQQLELAGNFEKGGLNVKSYASPIDIMGKEYMAFYVITSKNKQDHDSESQKLDVINKLKRIQQDFS